MELSTKRDVLYGISPTKQKRKCNMPTSISNIKVSVQQCPNNIWRFTVFYDAAFTQFEVDNFTFLEGFEIWEDDNFYPDKVTKLVGKVQFKPSKTQEPQRKLVADVSGYALDTELGAEEIYVKVRIQNLTIPFLPPTERNSNIINLAP
jgi:hypothetical protein